jgi:hypothetical protein
MYIQSFIKIGSDIQKLMEGRSRHTDIWTERWFDVPTFILKARKIG